MVSDIFGVSAMAMFRAMTKGQTDSLLLPSMAKGPLVEKHAELLKAITGKITDNYPFIFNFIQQELELLESTAGVSSRVA